MLLEEIIMPEARLSVICVMSFHFRYYFQNMHGNIAAMIGNTLIIRDHVIEDETVLQRTLLLADPLDMIGFHCVTYVIYDLL